VAAIRRRTQNQHELFCPELDQTGQPRFSLASPAGRLHARILASVAEYETEIRAERVHAGQQVARRKGKTWGGSEKGWRWRVTDEQVTAIQEMKAARTPIAKIARLTGLSRPTIYRVLSHLTQGVD